MNEWELRFWILVAVLALYIVLSIACHGAAYRNGCTDGFGFSKEPRCSGYKKAGEYLRRTMAHRWPELQQGDHNDPNNTG